MPATHSKKKRQCYHDDWGTPGKCQCVKARGQKPLSYVYISAVSMSGLHMCDNVEVSSVIKATPFPRKSVPISAGQYQDLLCTCYNSTTDLSSSVTHRKEEKQTVAKQGLLLKLKLCVHARVGKYSTCKTVTVSLPRSHTKRIIKKKQVTRW